MVQIGVDPMGNAICNGPRGVAPCAVITQWWYSGGWAQGPAPMPGPAAFPGGWNPAPQPFPGGWNPAPQPMPMPAPAPAPQPNNNGGGLNVGQVIDDVVKVAPAVCALFC